VTGMVFIRLEAGQFAMGSPVDERGRESQELQHPVTLSKPFWLGAYEVTQRQWTAVMGANPSSFQDGGDSLPVENVTWFEAGAFLQRLKERAPGNHFRLPSEAEWEYACRAGTKTAYSVGETLNRDQANFAESADRAGAGHTTRVGQFSPNGWGFFDMHGNVWEWTEDDHCPYASRGVTDPVARCGDPLKVIRGGSWYFSGDSARCALRYTHRPQDRGFSLGFRVVRTVD